MAEGVDYAALPLAIGHVFAPSRRVGAACSGSVERPVNIVNSKHDLVRGYNLLIVSKLAHQYLGTLAVDTELHAVDLADPNMFHQPEHLDIPGNRFPDVGHG